MIRAIEIRSVEHYVAQVCADANAQGTFWYRGEPVSDTPLLPKLYRGDAVRGQARENRLLQDFRRRAPAVDASRCPGRDETDEWLFLAQHVGLPTRLLDWTASPLIALFFALGMHSAQQNNLDCLVWSILPFELNRLTNPAFPDEFPLTWYNRPLRRPEDAIGRNNVRGAWEGDQLGSDLPVAVLGAGRHERILAQRGCFTIHGKFKSPMTELIPQEHLAVLKKYVIAGAQKPLMRHQLFKIGIGHLAAFPGLDSLARELDEFR